MILAIIKNQLLLSKTRAKLITTRQKRLAATGCLAISALASSAHLYAGDPALNNSAHSLGTTVATQGSDITLLALCLLALIYLGLLRFGTARSVKSAFLLSLSASMAAGPTMADMNSGLYLGVGGGMSMLEPHAESNAITSRENSDMDWHGTLGYRLNRSLSVELERADLGQAQLNPLGSIGYKDWNVSGIYHYKNRANSVAGKRFSIYGRAGVGKIYNKSNIAIERAHDVHWLAGAGVQMALSPALSFRAEAINYDKDAKRLGLGIVYAFGKNKSKNKGFSFFNRTAKKKNESSEAISSNVAVADEHDKQSKSEIAKTLAKAPAGLMFVASASDEAKIANGSIARTVATSPKISKALAATEAEKEALAKAEAMKEAQSKELAKAEAMKDAQSKELAKAEAMKDAQTKELAKAEARKDAQAKELAKAKAEKTAKDAKLKAKAIAKAEAQAKQLAKTDADNNAKRAIEIAKAQEQAKQLVQPLTQTDTTSTLSAQSDTQPFSPVTFGFDSNELNAQQHADMQPLVERLKNSPGATVTLTGHTDSTGSEAYNIGLSVRRADALKRYLLEQGIDRQAVIVRGLGEKKPVKSNRQASGRRANRRVEIDVNDVMEPPA